MTWTLRLYDEDGVEIGYAEKPDRDTFNYEITHPEDGWDSVERLLKFKSRVGIDPDYEIDTTRGRTAGGPSQIRLEPEEHLRLAKEQFFHPKVRSMELNDES